MKPELEKKLRNRKNPFDPDKKRTKKDIPKRFIVRYKDSISEKEIENTVKNHKVKVHKHSDRSPKIKTKFSVLKDLSKKQINDLNNDPNILYVEESQTFDLCGSPDDPRFNEQWALNPNAVVQSIPSTGHISAPNAWDKDTGGSTIVAVCDTGVDALHPDLAANMWTNPSPTFGDIHGAGFSPYYAEGVSGNSMPPTGPGWTEIVLSDSKRLTYTGITNIEFIIDVEPTNTDPIKYVYYQVGDTKTYTVTVRNTGNAPVYEASISVPKLGINITYGTLSMGASFSYTVNYVITPTDIASSFVTVTGGISYKLDEEDASFVTVTDTQNLTRSQTPGMVLCVTVDPLDLKYSNVGDTINYHVSVINIGVVEAVSVIVLDDMSVFSEETNFMPAAYYESPFTIPKIEYDLQYFITPEDITRGYIDNTTFCYAYQLSGEAQYHGTHVAGIIGAVGNNTTGISGVNWNVKIMSLQCFYWYYNEFGQIAWSIDTADVITAIDYAIAHGAVVINHSWGGFGNASGALADKWGDAAAANLICVCATGNSSKNVDVWPFYPSGIETQNNIAVNANSITGDMCYFTNYGMKNSDIFAPGGYTTGYSNTLNILSCWPVNPRTPGAPTESEELAAYRYISGTSMAAPQVTGAIALLKHYYDPVTSNMSNALVAKVLRACIMPNESTFLTCDYGGRLDLERLLDNITADQGIYKEEIKNIQILPDIDSPLDNILTWTNPTQAGFVACIISQMQWQYPVEFNNQTMIYANNGTTYRHEELQFDVIYGYKFEAVYSDGKKSIPKYVRARGGWGPFFCPTPPNGWEFICNYWDESWGPIDEQPFFEDHILAQLWRCVTSKNKTAGFYPLQYRPGSIFRFYDTDTPIDPEDIGEPLPENCLKETSIQSGAAFIEELVTKIRRLLKPIKLYSSKFMQDMQYRWLDYYYFLSTGKIKSYLPPPEINTWSWEYIKNRENWRNILFICREVLNNMRVLYTGLPPWACFMTSTDIVTKNSDPATKTGEEQSQIELSVPWSLNNKLNPIDITPDPVTHKWPITGYTNDVYQYGYGNTWMLDDPSDFRTGLTPGETELHFLAGTWLGALILIYSSKIVDGVYSILANHTPPYSMEMFEVICYLFTYAKALYCSWIVKTDYHVTYPPDYTNPLQSPSYIFFTENPYKAGSKCWIDGETSWDSTNTVLSGPLTPQPIANHIQRRHLVQQNGLLKCGEDWDWEGNPVRFDIYLKIQTIESGVGGAIWAIEDQDYMDSLNALPRIFPDDDNIGYIEIRVTLPPEVEDLQYDTYTFTVRINPTELYHSGGFNKYLGYIWVDDPDNLEFEFDQEFSFPDTTLPGYSYCKIHNSKSISYENWWQKAWSATEGSTWNMHKDLEVTPVEHIRENRYCVCRAMSVESRIDIQTHWPFEEIPDCRYVPDLRGLHIFDDADLIEDLADQVDLEVCDVLDVSTNYQEYEENNAELRIINQIPIQGQLAYGNRLGDKPKIKYTISAYQGGDYYFIPKVVGMFVDEAIEYLADNYPDWVINDGEWVDSTESPGYDPDPNNPNNTQVFEDHKLYEYSHQVYPGQIIGQNPDWRIRQPRISGDGKTINVVVSAGYTEGSQMMRSFIGRNLNDDDVQEWIHEMETKNPNAPIYTTYQFLLDTNLPTLTIMGQSPEKYRVFPFGAWGGLKLLLSVYYDPESEDPPRLCPDPIPDLSGKTFEEAQDISPYPVSRSARVYSGWPKDTVCHQLPKPGYKNDFSPQTIFVAISNGPFTCDDKALCEVKR